MPSSTTAELEQGALVAVRGQKWVVSEVDPADGSYKVERSRFRLLVGLAPAQR